MFDRSDSIAITFRSAISTSVASGDSIVQKGRRANCAAPGIARRVLEPSRRPAQPARWIVTRVAAASLIGMLTVSIVTSSPIVLSVWTSLPSTLT